MIRTLALICCDCKQEFTPKDKIYYRDNFLSKDIKDAQLICDTCIAKWQEKWKISKADFQEKDYVLRVTITLENGTVLENLDCTPLETTVITEEEMPLGAQEKLYEYYVQWDTARKEKVLKDCIFEDAFMRTTVTCTTYGGEHYENMAIRFNMKGELETEQEVPDYIRNQIAEAFKLYEAQNID